MTTFGSRPPIGALVAHDFGLPGVFMGMTPDGRIRLLVVETVYGADDFSCVSEFGGNTFKRSARSDVGIRFVPDGHLVVHSEAWNLQSLIVATVRRSARWAGTEIRFLHDVVRLAMQEGGDPNVFLAVLIVAANEGQMQADEGQHDEWRLIEDESAICDFMLYGAAIAYAAIALTIARNGDLPIPIRLSCVRSVDDPALLTELAEAFIALPYTDERETILQRSACFLIPWLVELEQTDLLFRIARAYTGEHFEWVFRGLDRRSRAVMVGLRLVPD